MVTVITGGTSGIGAAIAKNLLSKSQNDDDLIIVNYGHNEETAKNFLGSFAEPDAKKIRLIKADLSNFENMHQFIDDVLKISPKIDNLVLNAGIGTYEKFENYTPEIWNKVMNVNLNVPVFMVKELKNHINDGGSILFMGSMMGHRPHSTSVAYAVSKAGLQFFAQTVLKEFDGTGIRLNVVCPGFTETPWHDGRTQESYDRINNKIALHRFGTVEEVADICCSVMNNGYINGSVIDIDGGYSYF